MMNKLAILSTLRNVIAPGTFPPLPWIICISLLAGCASLGLEPAKDFDDQAAYGYATLASVRQSTANALDSGLIKVEDAKQVQALADQARAGLDAARGAWNVGDTKTALGRLELANSILNQLALYLHQRGVR